MNTLKNVPSKQDIEEAELLLASMKQKRETARNTILENAQEILVEAKSILYPDDVLTLIDIIKRNDLPRADKPKAIKRAYRRQPRLVRRYGRFHPIPHELVVKIEDRIKSHTMTVEAMEKEFKVSKSSINRIKSELKSALRFTPPSTESPNEANQPNGVAVMAH